MTFEEALAKLSPESIFYLHVAFIMLLCFCYLVIREFPYEDYKVYFTNWREYKIFWAFIIFSLVYAIYTELTNKLPQIVY
jgi:hypothetical protein